MPQQVYNALKYNPIRLKSRIQAWEIENRVNIERSNDSKNSIFLLNTPEHKNLGDLAIAEAEIDFLNCALPSKQIIEISSLNHNVGSVDALKKFIPHDTVILFHGGGYIGSDWPDEYETFRRTVMLFPNNRIVLLPQSVFFSDNATGRAALKRSIKDLSHHNDLHLIARESISYELLKTYYPKANIYLSPDMVLTMEYNTVQSHRKGVLLCMRSDQERLLTYTETDHIEQLCAKYGQVEYTDTFAPDEYCGFINARTRKALVDAKLEQFCKAELVITDRLHGMVFAAITGTPCVALSNHNHKVKGTAEWIKDLDYISYVDDTKDIAEAVHAALSHGPDNYNRDKLITHYDIIKEIIEA